MDVYGFPPNSPALMRQPPPKKKGIVGIADIMKCLATKHQSSVTIATVYDLTRIFSDEVRSAPYSLRNIRVQKYLGSTGAFYFPQCKKLC